MKKAHNRPLVRSKQCNGYAALANHLAYWGFNFGLAVAQRVAKASFAETRATAVTNTSAVCNAAIASERANAESGNSSIFLNMIAKSDSEEGYFMLSFLLIQ